MSDSKPMSGADRVIVVGAGPVGLLTALRLGQAGIWVDVLEQNENLCERPRAAGYYAAALLALEKARVLDSAGKAGFTTQGLYWRKPLRDGVGGAKRLGDVIARLGFPEGTGVSGALILPQSELAKVLFDEAVATGFVKVHFGRDLSAIQEKGNTVLATARTPDSTEESFQGSFLVGADGGKSMTRRLLGIPFKGYSWPERILAVDLLMEDKEIDLSFPTSLIVDLVHYGILTPLDKPNAGTKTRYRCSLAIDLADTRTDAQLASEGSVMQLLEKVIPGPRPLDVQVLHASVYRMHQLCASTFRKGRCLLAGDAAHLNNPFGAMGLSTGMIDADAASDALELIIKRGNSLALLDVYSDERRKVFQMFVDPVSAQNKLRCANDPETAMEDWFLRTLSTASEADMANLGRPFFDMWRTDMSKFADAA